MTRTPATPTPSTTLLDLAGVDLPSPAHVTTAVVDLPPGDPGTPPHRHAGPVFGFVLTGALLFELDDRAPRVLAAGEAFWEPGGELVHWQAANALATGSTRFVVVMTSTPGRAMLELLTDEEILRRGRDDLLRPEPSLAERHHR